MFYFIHRFINIVEGLKILDDFTLLNLGSEMLILKSFHIDVREFESRYPHLI